MTTVSVIMPTFNRSAFLPAAVESAQQAGSDLEVMVVDDGSTDNTPEVCRRLTGIRYIRLSSNQGLAAARNAGIRASSSEFIAFLDDDDLRLPGTIDPQVTALKANQEAALSYGRVFLADSKHRRPTGEIAPLRMPTGDIFWDLIEGFFLVSAAVVARRQSLLECGLFDERLRTAEDWDLWLRLTETQRVIASNEALGIYRKAARDSKQICSDTISLIRQMLLVQNAALQRGRAAAAPSWKRKRARLRLLKFAYNSLLSEAEAALAHGDIRGARAHSREARRLRPFRAPIDARFWRLYAPRNKAKLH